MRTWDERAPAAILPREPRTVAGTERASVTNLGCWVKKQFGGLGIFEGVVTSTNDNDGGGCEGYRIFHVFVAHSVSRNNIETNI